MVWCAIPECTQPAEAVLCEAHRVEDDIGLLRVPEDILVGV